MPIGLANGLVGDRRAQQFVSETRSKYDESCLLQEEFDHRPDNAARRQVHGSDGHRATATGYQTESGLSDSQLGLLSGVAFAAFYAITGIGVARWADRGNRRATIGPGNTVGANRTGPALAISDRKSMMEVPLEFRNRSGIITGDSNLELGGVDVVGNLDYQNVNNVLNQDRLRAVSLGTFRLQSTAGTFLDSGYRTASINAPREFGVSGRFSF